MKCFHAIGFLYSGMQHLNNAVQWYLSSVRNVTLIKVSYCVIAILAPENHSSHENFPPRVYLLLLFVRRATVLLFGLIK